MNWHPFKAFILIFIISINMIMGESMLAPPRVFILPPSDLHHSIEIRREESEQSDAKWISLAEKALEEVHLKIKTDEEPLSLEKSPQRNFDVKAIKDFVELIEEYRKTSFVYFNSVGMVSEGDEVGSSFSVDVGVGTEDKVSEEGQTFRDVVVVKFEISFQARQTQGGPFLEMICGFPEVWTYRRESKVIFDSRGKVLMVRALVKSDLKIEKIKGSSVYDEPYENIARGLAFVDHTHAKKWAGQILDSSLRKKMIFRIEQIGKKIEAKGKTARDWAFSGQVGKAHRHSSGGYTSYRGKRLSVGVCYQCEEVSVARNWAALDPLEAANWAFSLEDQLAKDGALVAITARWAMVDPGAMAEWFKQHITPTSKVDLFLMDTVRRLAESSPERVVKLLDHFSDLEMREIARKNIADRWAYKQPWLAGKLALKMAPGTERERVLKTVANQWSMRGDAKRARAWAGNIPEEAERAIYLKAIVLKP